MSQYKGNNTSFKPRYAVNEAKWKAAREFCNDRKIEFKIITEQELGIYNGR